MKSEIRKLIEELKLKYEPIVKSFADTNLEDPRFGLEVTTSESELAPGKESLTWLSISLSEINSESLASGRFRRSYVSINIYTTDETCLLMLSFPIGESHKKRVMFKDLTLQEVTTYFDGYLTRLKDLIPMM